MYNSRRSRISSFCDTHSSTVTYPRCSVRCVRGWLGSLGLGVWLLASPLVLWPHLLLLLLLLLLLRLLR